MTKGIYYTSAIVCSFLLLSVLLWPNYQADTIGEYLGEEINFETLKVQNKSIETYVEKDRLRGRLSLFLKGKTYDKMLQKYSIEITQKDITNESKKMAQTLINKMSVDERKKSILMAKDIFSAISALEKGMANDDVWEQFLKKHNFPKGPLNFPKKYKMSYQLMAQGKFLESAMADNSLDKLSVYQLKSNRIMDEIYKESPKLSKEIDLISQLTDDEMYILSFKGDNLKKSLAEIKTYCELSHAFEIQKELYQKPPRLEYHLPNSDKFKLNELNDINKIASMRSPLSIHPLLTPQSLTKIYANLTNELSLKIKHFSRLRSDYALSSQHDIILKGKEGDAGLRSKGDEFIYIKNVKKSSQKLTHIKKDILMRILSARVREMISKNLKLEKKYSFLKN